MLVCADLAHIYRTAFAWIEHIILYKYKQSSQCAVHRKNNEKKEKNQRRRILVNILTEWTKWNKYKLAHTHWPKVEGGADRVVRARVCLKTLLFCSWRFLIALSYICARYNLNGILLFCYNQVILIWSLDFYIQNSSHSTKTAEKKFGSIMDPIYIGWH